MDKCFVIQPFDKDKFDKRFSDVFEPAINKANLEAYRIDRDLSVRIPIDDIEKGILESSICFAEITADNPNVWYELGFAFACGKDVIMVCSDERLNGKFPFDIQHRHIITYKTGSKSDFEELETAITKKILAFQKKAKQIQTLQESPVVPTEGLKSHEIAILIFLIENQFTAEDQMSVYNIKSEMQKAGYTDVATGVGIRILSKKNYLVVFSESDWNNNQYSAVRLTEEGASWILNNQDQLVFRKEKTEPQKKNRKSEISVDDLDLPF